MEEYFDASQAGELRILLNILIASVLTGIIGSEREISQKPAGFRTNMLVGASATLLISIGPLLLENFASYPYEEARKFDELLQVDPMRLIEAIVVGVSFIGGGTILKSEDKEKVRYLTSAATILLSAGVGIAVAVEKYVLAIGITIFVFIVNRIIGRVEKRFGNKNRND